MYKSVYHNNNNMAVMCSIILWIHVHASVHIHIGNGRVIVSMINIELSKTYVTAKQEMRTDELCPSNNNISEQHRGCIENNETSTGGGDLREKVITMAWLIMRRNPLFPNE